MKKMNDWTVCKLRLNLLYNMKDKNQTIILY